MIRGKKVDGRKSSRNQRRKNGKKPGLSSFNQIKTVFNITTEEMKVLLKCPALIISGVLYDVPIFQIQKYLDEGKEGDLEFTLNKSENQDPNQKNEIQE